MELRLPKEGAIAQKNDVAGARSSGIRAPRHLAPMQRAEIRVNIEIQGEILGGAQNHAFILGAVQVANDRFDSNSMGLFWGG